MSAPMSIQTVEPTFIFDGNELGRLGLPDDCVSAYEQWTTEEPLVSASWWRRYNVGERLRIIDEDGYVYTAEVVTVIDNGLGHGYAVRPDWDSATRVTVS